MKIVIVCYSYSDNFAYMEQKLAVAFSELGHETTIICSTANRIDSKTIVKVKPQKYRSHNYNVVRLPFIIGGHVPDHKLPIILKGVYKELCKIKPDIIYHMSISAINLLSVKKYVKRNKCRLFVDNHASSFNSANNFLSLFFLHKVLYKSILKSTSKYISNYFYVGKAEKIFMKEIYKINENKLTFFSLGDFIVDNNQYFKTRNKLRNDLNICSSDFVITISGKLTSEKRTIDILKMFYELSLQFKGIKFILVGDIQDESIRNEFNDLQKLLSISLINVGWKSSNELKDLLCASDLYIQYAPSSTFQTSLCCRCFAITCDPFGVYKEYQNPPFIVTDTIDHMKVKIIELINQPNYFLKKREQSFNFAKEYLDYKEQVRRLIFGKR